MCCGRGGSGTGAAASGGKKCNWLVSSGPAYPAPGSQLPPGGVLVLGILFSAYESDRTEFMMGNVGCTVPWSGV